MPPVQQQAYPQQPPPPQAYNQPPAYTPPPPQPQPSAYPLPNAQQPGYPPQTYQQQQMQRSAPPGYYPTPQPYMHDNTSLVNIWGPFAGFGTRRKHMGWLLDNRGDSANNLIDQVRNGFANRQIEGVSISQETLIARGLLVEMRNYFLLRKRLASVGLYINNFGKDLYLSIVTYLKPPVSNVRVLLLAISVLFGLFSTFVFPAMLNSALNDAFSGVSSSLFGGGGSTPSADGLLTLLCLIGPAGFINSLALTIFVIYSCYKWVTEKDILAGLRTTPNEFNEDDLMAMEKAAEQTVRMAMDELGLDPTNLKPVAPNQPTRLF
jgi:hypothetical protein